MTRAHLIAGLSTLTLAITAGLIAAGPLAPPAGPVGATYKTLAEVEPRIAINAANTPGDDDSLFKITQPGSYYLTGNILGVPHKRAIEIASNNVTLDLSGFALVGVALSLEGVSTPTGQHDVVIRNGILRGWSVGVNLYVSGIDYGEACRIENIVASHNATGIDFDSGAVVTGCSACQNSQYGIAGGGEGGVVVDCSAYDNGFDGIYCGLSSTIRGCTSSGNGGRGFGCAEGLIADCTASFNGYVGFQVTAGSIERCVARGNTQHGILLSNACTAIGNSCFANGQSGAGAGIHCDGSDSRIEGNTCNLNDWGIRATSSGNFISKNICSGNTTANWSVVAGNVCYVVNATTSPAVNGNNGGVSPGSTDPNANFTY